MTDPNYVAPQLPNSSSRSLAMLAHLSALGAFVIGFGFVGPLIIWLLKKDEDAYVGQEALEALNFNLSVFIYGTVATVVGFILLFFVIGIFVFLLMLPAGIAWLILVILGAVEANKGTGYRYPLNLRLIK